MPPPMPNMPAARPGVATVSFVHDRHTPSAIAAQLSAAGLYCHWGDNYAFELARALDLDPEQGVVRLGLGHYNTAEEVSTALDLIKLGKNDQTRFNRECLL